VSPIRLSEDVHLTLPLSAFHLSSSSIKTPIRNGLVCLFVFSQGLVFLPQVASNCDPPTYSFLSSWDYRHEPHSTRLGVFMEDNSEDKSFQETELGAQYFIVPIV
jgi:hypothetical protein